MSDPAPVGLVRGVGAALSAIRPGGSDSRLRGDLDNRDPDWIREMLPTLWLFASVWTRAEVRGLHHVPADGPVLLVGNHSGGNFTPDTFAFVTAFSSYFGVERRFYQLAHDLVLKSPLGRIGRPMGMVAANPRNTNAALDAGAAVLVYPGGDHEVFRPSWERHSVDFGGRSGFISLALEKGVPIVPVVSIGGQETAFFLSRGKALARWLRLDRAVRLKSLPILLAPPWGLVVGDFAGRIPLPAKITVQVLPPIDLPQEFGPDPDVEVVYREVIRRMQDVLTSLAEDRRLPLIG